MKKYLIVYYSNTGNSRFIAEELAKSLKCDIKSIDPGIRGIFPLFILSALKINIPVGVSQKDIAPYDEIIVLGPIWGGQLISPLRSILKKCVKASKPVHFAVSCETSDEEKQGKYGYDRVLKASKKIAGELLKTSEAFTTALIKNQNDEQRNVLTEKIKITPENFKGPIKLRFENFSSKIKSGQSA